MLWAGSSHSCLLKEGNPLVSTPFPLFVSLSLCPQHLFHVRTVLITSQWASQGMISSYWPTSHCSGLYHFLVTHWNLTYHHFSNLFLLLISLILLMLVFLIPKLFLTFFPSFLTPLSLFLTCFSFSFLLRYTKHLHPTERFPYSHRPPAAPLKQYILHCPLR